MKLIVLYLSMLCVGYFIASKHRDKKSQFGFVPSLTMWVIYVLVFIMGMKMGVNEQVTSNLGIIGLQALVITVFCIGGSMLAVFGARKMMGMDRYGNLTGKDPVEIRGEEEEKEKETEGFDGNVAGNSDLKSTVIILALTAAGLLAGCFGIARYAQESIPQFNDVSGDVMVVLLCGLLFLVGFDMGLAGNVFRSIRAAGLRIMVFPFVAIAGTLIFGAASSVLFGFSLKQGLAISAGFGWYTYAPTVIADAGAQHIVASAVSFMHNVIRETAGIVFIPVIAKKFGYLESTTVPGVAAMDICMPIVERSCRQDTVVYSFAIGLTMSIAGSVLVPLFIG